jgi:hypothetical protein
MNLNQMRRIADNSLHPTYHHSALIFSGNRLLAYGYNFRETHAEASAIRRLRRRVRRGLGKDTLPNNLHLVSFMYKKSSGNMGTSLPCPDCMELLKLNGIRTITYFDRRQVPCQLNIKA